MTMSLVLGMAVVGLMEYSLAHASADRFVMRMCARRGVRTVCAGCARQRALFRQHGIVKWDRYHTLCFRCFRAQVDQRRGIAGA
jgi:hypothetical protein